MNPIPPKISVVMSVYNGETFVAESIDSVLAQTFEDYEFIIVDDGSTDKTSNILASFSDDRIRLISRANTGLTVALNEALRHCRAPFIARQDADDISYPDRFASQMEYLEQHAEVSAVGSWATVIDAEGDAVGMHCNASDPVDIKRKLWSDNMFVHGSLMLRRHAIESVDAYRSQFRYAQDYDLLLRLSDRYRVANIPRSLYGIRHWRGKISVDKLPEQLAFRQLAQTLAAQRRRGEQDALQHGESIDKLLIPVEPPSPQHFENTMLYYCLRSGHLAKARRIIRELMQTNPGSTKPYIQLALTYLGPTLSTGLLKLWDRTQRTNG
ncbi:MAG: glycosyltransferase [Gammaproteobacteria bacterium]|nr:glycosyltransferase [Gammaproteobacteria bacterium]MDH3467943.1 glycosyltransferase [Gammaproteobacteria bacterium]